MICLTSIAPTTHERQLNAVASWLTLGYKVYSFNSVNDIHQIQDKYIGVEFIETKDIGREFGKDYVRLNPLIEWIKTNSDALILNSDIEILAPVKLDLLSRTLHIFNRNNYNDNVKSYRRFDSGFDAFYVTKELAIRLPKTMLVIGQCHWDYWLPLRAIELGFKLKQPKVSPFYHKIHPLQYNRQKWLHTGSIFADELKLSGHVAQDSTRSHAKIKANIKYY